MHSSRELRSDSFEIDVAGSRVALTGLFEGSGARDRLGVVVRGPCGAVGASALICATITAFYDVQRARGGEFFVPPDYSRGRLASSLAYSAYGRVRDGDVRIAGNDSTEGYVEAILVDDALALL